MSETLRRRGSVALLVLLSLLVGSFPVLHADGAEDPDCLPLFVGHNESAHHFSAASGVRSASGEHCFLCHSARTFNQPRAKGHQSPVYLNSERLPAGRLATPPHSEWSPTAGRAPPSLL